MNDLDVTLIITDDSQHAIPQMPDRQQCHTPACPKVMPFYMLVTRCPKEPPATLRSRRGPTFLLCHLSL